MSNQIVASGTAVFSHVMEEDTYQGAPVGYSLTVTLDPESVAELESQGAKLKEYEGTMQKKFTSKYRPQVVDLEGDYVNREIPRGSKVRVLVGLGQENEQWGTKCYLNKVRLVEMAEADVPDDF